MGGNVDGGAIFMGLVFWALVKYVFGWGIV